MFSLSFLSGFQYLRKKYYADLGILFSIDISKKIIKLIQRRRSYLHKKHFVDPLKGFYLKTLLGIIALRVRNYLS